MKKQAKTQKPDVVDALTKLTGRTREESEAQVATASRECFLCGKKPADLVGLFLPYNVQQAQRYGAPAGKYRIVVYGLCETCQSGQGTVEAVEAKLLRSLTRH